MYARDSMARERKENEEPFDIQSKPEKAINFANVLLFFPSSSCCNANGPRAPAEFLFHCSFLGPTTIKWVLVRSLFSLELLFSHFPPARKQEKKNVAKLLIGLTSLAFVSFFIFFFSGKIREINPQQTNGLFWEGRLMKEFLNLSRSVRPWTNL